MALGREGSPSAPRREARVLIVDWVASRRGGTSEDVSLGLSWGHDRATNSEQLQDRLRTHTYAVAILASGACPEGKWAFSQDLAAAEMVRKAQPGCQLLFVVGKYLDLDDCCRAVQSGAAGFVTASPSLAVELNERVGQLVARWEEDQDEVRLMHEADLVDETGIATQSEAMLRLLVQARKAAAICDAPIVLEGESGTGKQLFAEAIHRMDPKRRSRPFISVNCAAITGTLAESALFGHKRGAFTGATEDRLGYFRAASGGTLMLDEISELEPALQPKLLRVLQEGRVLPVGDDREHAVDVRPIVASNKPLAEEVAKGRFRLDLYQRLNVIRLHLPPLRERLEDIPLLVRFFLEKYAHYYREAIEDVEPAVYAVLQRAVGEGNVRELENIIRQALVFKTSGSVLTVVDLPEAVRQRASLAPVIEPMPSDLAAHIAQLLERGPIDLSEAVEGYECQILRTAMRDLRLRGIELARHLNLNRRTLYHKLRRYRLLETSS